MHIFPTEGSGLSNIPFEVAKELIRIVSPRTLKVFSEKWLLSLISENGHYLHSYKIFNNTRASEILLRIVQCNHDGETRKSFIISRRCGFLKGHSI